MKRNIIYTIILCSATFSNLLAQVASKNPFFEEWTTPYGIPPFDKIKIEHFVPAFEEGMLQQEKAINAIIDSKEPPTFKNTIEAIENSSELLDKVSSVFSNIRSANTNAELQKIASEIFPKLSAHRDNINLNSKLFEKIKIVYANRTKEKLTPEQIRLTEKYYKSFVRSGANLNENDKARMRNINAELSKLTLAFGDNLLAETNSFILTIDNEKNLVGLPSSVIKAAKEEAISRKLSDKWIFTLQKTSLIPFLQYSQNRKLREFLYKGYLNRANNNNEFDNKKILVQIVLLRLEKAKLLGYENHASFILEENMAKTANKVFDLIDKIWEPAINRAVHERDELLMTAKLENSNFDQIESWDWWYYSEKVRKNKYNIDEEELRPYFKLENVRNGIFDVVNKLYGITFKEQKNLPVYHPEVTVFEVVDNDKQVLGVLLMDFFPRASKRGGAWCTTYRSAYYKNSKRVTPVVSIVCNFTKPTSDTPSLLNMDEVETFFHEFGHAIHALVSNCQYKGSTSVPRDFVELPSQIMEHWATETIVLKQYAKHYKTNKPISDELIAKINKSSFFNQGFATCEYLAAAYLDMMYHTMNFKDKFDVNEMERAILEKKGLITSIAPRYRSTYFQHIFSGGYSAGYYSYIWSEVLDADAFQAFKETGDIFNKKIATAFRKKILENGNTKDPLQMYIDFRGSEPRIEPLLRNRGLL